MREDLIELLINLSLYGFILFIIALFIKIVISPWAPYIAMFSLYKILQDLLIIIVMIGFGMLLYYLIICIIELKKNEFI